MSPLESNSSKAQAWAISSALTIFEKRLIASTILLVILNIMDVELTLWGIRLHLIEDGNPLMQLLIEKNPLYIKTLKLLLPTILGVACWWTRKTSQTLIVYGMGVLLIVYSCVLLLHAHWMYTAALPALGLQLVNPLLFCYYKY